MILYMCTKNYDQIMYSSWDMVCDGCNYFSSLAIFCSFTAATVQKIKILKKWKNCLQISSLYIDVPKIMIRWCTVCEIWCVTEVINISPFGLIFCPFTPLTAQKIRMLKKWKKTYTDIILHMCTTNYDQTMYSSSDMVCDKRTDGWMDGKSDA